jgi:hypothetical protein
MKRLFVHPRGSLLTAAAMLTLAACSGAVTVTGHKNISGAYRPGELYVVATGDNELRTIIVGNPFDLPKAEFDKAVLATLKGRNIGPTLNLSTSQRRNRFVPRDERSGDCRPTGRKPIGYRSLLRRRSALDPGGGPRRSGLRRRQRSVSHAAVANSARPISGDQSTTSARQRVTRYGAARPQIRPVWAPK